MFFARLREQLWQLLPNSFGSRDNNSRNYRNYYFGIYHIENPLFMPDATSLLNDFIEARSRSSDNVAVLTSSERVQRVNGGFLAVLFLLVTWTVLVELSFRVPSDGFSSRLPKVV
jgi:hypothetical protein